MRERNFDYRRDGWHQSASPTNEEEDDDVCASAAPLWCAWVASLAFQAIMATTCLVVAIASFFFANEAAMYSQGSNDMAFAISVSFMVGGFMAIVAATTTIWWLLVLAILPALWAYGNQGYNDNGSLVTLTYIFDGCVVVLAVGLVVARSSCCHQDSSSPSSAGCAVDQEQQEVYSELDDDHDGDSPKRQSRKGRSRRAPMVTEIV